MKPPAKSCKSFSAIGILVLFLAAFASQAFADTKPKYLYVTNSGESNPGDQLETFQVTATATCTSSPCASTFTITGSFTLDLGLGRVSYSTLFLTDSSDLASSPLALMSAFPPALPTASTTSPLTFNTDGFFNGGSTLTNLTLYLPFTNFPGNYAGGAICTSVSVSGCAGISKVIIQSANMSASLRATSGGNPVTATIVSGSVTLVGSVQSSNTVSGYSIDATTGALTPLPGSPFIAGSNPFSVALDPSSKFLYVANRLSGNISAYEVNATSGALSQISGSPFTTGSEPDSVTVAPSGKFVFVSNQLSDNIWVYSIDSETGALTPINGSPFPSGHSPVALTMDPLGRFLYVSDYDTEAPAFDFRGFTIDGTTGALTQIPPADILGGPGIGPLGAAIDPTGRFLFGIGYFIPHWGVGVSGINSATGGLGNEYSGDGSDIPSAVATHPSGKFVYITDASSSYVTGYSIDSTTGDMTRIPGTPFGDQCAHVTTCFPTGPSSTPYATGSLPESIAIDPSGKFAYVGNMHSNNISAFTIDATTGAFAPIVGSPFAAGVGPSSVAIASASTVPFDTFKATAEIDEDRKTSFRVEGFFTLGAGSDGIYPLSESVQLQVGSYSATLPAGSFAEKDEHQFDFDGTINNVDLKIKIHQVERKRDDGKNDKDKKVETNDYLFTAEGKGSILAGVTNPVTVTLTIGDDEGSTTVKADIDK